MNKKIRKWISHTDKSHYKPNVNILNNLMGKNMSDITGMYDFKDGKDDGTRYHDVRDLGADRVEIDNAINKAIETGNNIKNNIKSELKAEYNKIMQNESMKKQTPIEK